jgi:exosortase/archaeosortase family protein
VVKFLFVFCLLYFGTLAIIGLSTPEGYYSPFTADHLNYINWLRSSFLHTCKGLLSLFGYQSTIVDKYTLRIKNANAIRMVYTCIGYGVMSFWIAFVISNKVIFKKKIIWIFAGLLMIWATNTIRIFLVLIADNKHWSFPFGLDHHTWFNIVAYIFIFILIYLFDRSTSKLDKKFITPKP